MRESPSNNTSIQKRSEPATGEHFGRSQEEYPRTVWHESYITSRKKAA